MYKQHLCRSDLHVHTNHSLCAPRSTQVESYLPFCEDEGIHLLGITNHLYAEGGYIDSTPYLDYILQVQKELDVLQNKTSVRFLFGCESELFPNREPGLNPQYSHYFNYVLFAPSHIFNCINFYEGIDLSSADKVRELMVAQFCRACTLEYEIPVGICHPLYPICCPWEQEVVDGISDEVLADCFSLAAKHHRSIEIHACLYRNGTVLDKEEVFPHRICDYCMLQRRADVNFILVQMRMSLTHLLVNTVCWSARQNGSDYARTIYGVYVIWYN